MNNSKKTLPGADASWPTQFSRLILPDSGANSKIFYCFPHTILINRPPHTKLVGLGLRGSTDCIINLLVKRKSTFWTETPWTSYLKPPNQQKKKKKSTISSHKIENSRNNCQQIHFYTKGVTFIDAVDITAILHGSKTEDRSSNDFSNSESRGAIEGSNGG